jgi:hypothetical protein
MPNLWEELTKHREIPSKIPMPDGIRDFINGDRDQKKLLRIAVALNLVATGRVIEGVTSSAEIAKLIEEAAKKINW